MKVTISDGRSVKEVSQAIAEEYKLKVPEPNYIQSVLTVNDPLYENQWYVQETKFDLAWDKLKGRDTVKVAVIDTGVQADHPDLQGKILKGYDFVSGKEDVVDDNGHGTFVAGIIAGNTNDIGIKGLYDYARIIPIKVIDANGVGTYEDAAKGIIFAADSGQRL